MKVKIIVFVALCGIVHSAVFSIPVLGAETGDDGFTMKYLLVETSDGKYEIEDLVNSHIDTRATESDVTYQFFSQQNPDVPVQIKTNSISLLHNSTFRPSKDTLFVIHGWRNHHESPVNYEVKTAVLSRYDVNVFVVDWSHLARKNYVSAKNAVVPVGNFVAAFIQSLVATFGVEFSKVSLVGHSLGAHVCGNAGAALDGQLDHIVGLDPASPLFSYSNTANRLDPTDAKFVQVIHTNGGLLGFSASIGHVDYFPNGGSRQPGCGLDASGSCAHARSYAYYAESVFSSQNSFVSRACDSYKDYSRGNCGSNVKSSMGGYVIDMEVSGDFYLDTNSASPYGRG